MTKQIHANTRTKLKNIVCFIITLIMFSVFMSAISQIPANAWESDDWGDGTVDRNFDVPRGTHQWVASRGFEILKNEQNAVFNWFNAQGNISAIVKYADWPDEGLSERTDSLTLQYSGISYILRPYHFYFYPSGKTLVGSTTAVDRFVYWYNSAVAAYKSGDKAASYRFLGNAVHYIADLSTPVHTGVSSIIDAAHYISIHKPYERDALEYTDTAAATVSRGGRYQWAMSNSLRSIAISAAADSSGYYRWITADAIRNRPSSYIEAITEPLKNTQLNVAQVFYRFYIDVTGIENRTYVTVSGKNTPVWSQPQSTGSSTQVSSLAAGTIVTIASTQRNDAGNMWGRVAGKDCYIFMDNLTTYRPPVLTPLASDRQSYVTAQKNVVVYTEPSSYSAIARTIANENTAVVIASTTTNTAGNLWGRIKDGEYIYMGNVRASSSSTTTPNQTPSQSLSVVSTVEGSFRVTVPANYRLDCFQSPTATTRSTYVSAKSASYTISCTKRLTMSDGTTRYFFRSGDNKDLYFVFTSSMSLSGSSTSATYTLKYDANGGTGAPPSQTRLSDGPRWIISSIIPTRSGYSFEGWSSYPNSSAPTFFPGEAFGMSADATLYAVWKIIPSSAATVSFSGYDSRWTIASNAVPWIERGRYEVTYTFGCSLRVSSSHHIDSVEFALYDDRMNEIANTVNYTSKYTYGFPICMSSGIAYNKLESDKPGYWIEDTAILAQLKDGRTYYWKVIVTSDGQRFESGTQSFVFAAMRW